MVLEPGANGCKPIDRCTKYANTGEILGNDDTSAVLTDHFKDIYTDSDAFGKEEESRKPGML